MKFYVLLLAHGCCFLRCGPEVKMKLPKSYHLAGQDAGLLLVRAIKLSSLRLPCR